ncbi:MAG: type II secretion system protein GspG [Polyangiaceae bacterium]|nr:type II secretion system protein GspG [Polyangiaceae bacterium]
MMYRTRRQKDRQILFPWEGRGGVRRYLKVRRVGPPVIVLLMASLMTWVVAKERRASGERRTRARLIRLRSEVSHYLAAHDGECPPNLAALLPGLGKESLPRDAWGRGFRFICPAGAAGGEPLSHVQGNGRVERLRPSAGVPDFILLSDGPDGVPGGLDRIEF